MNTELEEKAKMLNAGKETIIGLIKSHQRVISAHKEAIQIIDAEIESLSKIEPPAPLTFLQLAEKYEHPFLDILNRDGYVEWPRLQGAFTEKEARKFVAEIYLILLAKELNGNSVINFRVGTMLKYYIGYSHINTCMVINDHLINDAGILYFATKEIAEKALAYSPEAITMWNWYFNIEEVSK